MTCPRKPISFFLALLGNMRTRPSFSRQVARTRPFFSLVPFLFDLLSRPKGREKERASDWGFFLKCPRRKKPPNLVRDMCYSKYYVKEKKKKNNSHGQMCA
nr:hypothetical protein [Pandoravirus aubagnensis]